MNIKAKYILFIILFISVITFYLRLSENANSDFYLHILNFMNNNLWWIVCLISLIAVLGISYLYSKYIFKKGSDSKLNSQEEQKSIEEKYKTNRITDSECKEIYERLLSFMDGEEKPYSNPDLKIGDLSKAVNVSSHTLSYVFNQYINRSYNDFINDYRIDEFKKIAMDADASKNTLEVMAHMCGFNSRASFFRTFKKNTGTTPNEYLKSVRAHSEENA